jgi:two-component system, LytTR family, sensor kinase
MNHPFFDNRKLIFIYFAIWIMISTIHVFILQNIYMMRYESAIADSLVFNIMFSLFGIPLWYIVSFTKPGKYAIINQLINHVTSASILLIIWISAGNAIMRVLINDPAYDVYLEGSITWHVVSGLFFYSILVLIYYIIIYYNDMKERTVREARLNDIVKQVELDNLRSQINPHFLFNSLNSISSLTITSPEKAQEMIIKLSDLLRYSISQNENNMSTLQAEMDNIKRYLDIEQVRFGSKLVQEYNVDKGCLSREIPAMILQPIFENAVKHGVYESTEPIKILTVGSMNNNILVLKISNNFDSEARSRKGAGIGLKNIKERLKLIYGSYDLLKIKTEGNIFITELLIPQKEI